MAGTLLQARAVDVLVLDLAGGAAEPRRPPGRRRAGPARPRRPAPRPTGAGAARRPPPLADQLARLVAFARRAGALLLVLEPAETPAPLRAALRGVGPPPRAAADRLDPARAGGRRPADGGPRREGPPRGAGPADDPPAPLRGGRAARPLPRPRRAPGGGARRRGGRPTRRRTAAPTRHRYHSLPTSQTDRPMRLLHLAWPHLALRLARRRDPAIPADRAADPRRAAVG